MPTETLTRFRPAGDQKKLINAVTLIALGLSILILDSWSNLFVRLFVGLFWGSFVLILNGPGFIRTIRVLQRANAKQRRIDRGLAAFERRSSSY
jgi:hypothetical protein